MNEIFQAGRILFTRVKFLSGCDFHDYLCFDIFCFLARHKHMSGSEGEQWEIGPFLYGKIPG